MMAALPTHRPETSFMLLGALAMTGAIGIMALGLAYATIASIQERKTRDAIIGGILAIAHAAAFAAGVWSIHQLTTTS